ncbi:MAG: hypothetical protein B6242_08410 [Anaerolineaceae bacterium 4572_78]|nr:MAG: hypothetical protein B6242_08410 [Anaerolineaceae bacterium 4572_78]
MDNQRIFTNKLWENYDKLRKRKEKYVGEAPLGLLNQIRDHEAALNLTNQWTDDKINNAIWFRKMRPLVLAIENRTGESRSTIKLKDITDIYTPSYAKQYPQQNNEVHTTSPLKAIRFIIVGVLCLVMIGLGLTKIISFSTPTPTPTSMIDTISVSLIDTPTSTLTPHVTSQLPTYTPNQTRELQFSIPTVVFTGTVNATLIAKSIKPTPTSTPTSTSTSPPTTYTPTSIATHATTQTFIPTSTTVLSHKNGRLAVAIDNKMGYYDVMIYRMPSGDIEMEIEGVRQPTFRHDGQRLLVNGEGAGRGDAWEINVANWQFGSHVSGAAADSYPFYNPEGNRVVYSNNRLYSSNKSFIYVQCGLSRPQNDVQEQCKEYGNIVLLPDVDNAEIVGSHPVWTGNDHIAYKGCNTWYDGNTCGIFIVPSWTTVYGGARLTPSQLTGVQGHSTTPTDAHNNLILYHASETGNWEVYLTTVNGGVTNLSNNPASDGMATFSPDGQWVAFISDRSDGWAVWVVPVRGGMASKLFDLPPNPWGTGDRAWYNERMSWGR